MIVPYFETDVYMFKLAIIATTGLELLHVVKTILKQCNAELFFIDWEQGKALNIENIQKESSTKSTISVWRSIFMSNEFARLQVFRKCDIQFSLIGVLILLKVFNLRNLASVKPDLSDLTPGTNSAILLFAADSICWIIVIFGQLLFRYIFYDRFYRNRVNQYVDILSLANISLLVFDEHCHGYYIHGKSVHATADTDMEELNNYLMKEEVDESLIIE